MAVRLSNISSKTGKIFISIHNKYTNKNIFDDSYLLVIHFPDFPDGRTELLTVKAFIQIKQFCSPRAGNSGKLLLTSRNGQKYFFSV